MKFVHCERCRYSFEAPASELITCRQCNGPTTPVENLAGQSKAPAHAGKTQELKILQLPDSKDGSS